jgi:uncharacterized protein DUF3987
VNAPHLLKPNVADISAHLHALFPPEFVHQFPDAQIEIVYGPPGKFTDSRWFSAFDPRTIAEFVEVRNAKGDNIYIGAALRKGPVPESGRANTIQNYLAAQYAWCEYDSAGDYERIVAICRDKQLEPAIIATTGTVPHVRQHLYFRIKGGLVATAEQDAVNDGLRGLLGSDHVKDPIRIMRLGGCINYPTEKKRERGYVAELVTVKVAQEPREYSIEELMALRPTQPRQDNRFDFSNAKRQSSLGFKFARSDDDISELLQKSKTPGQWHNSMRDAIASMVGRGWSDDSIRFSCAPYCDGGKDDPHLDPLIDGARKKWDKPNPDDASATEAPGANIPPSADPVDLWAKFDPPTLPRGILPPVIEQFAFEQGMDMGADMAGIAVSALAVCAAAIPDKIKLQVKRHNKSWLESARIWVSLVGSPSSKKSPILSAAVSPLRKIDAEKARQYAEQKSRYDKLEKDEKAKTEPPKQTRLLLQDTTIEAAQDILKDSPNGVLCFQDELSGWFGSMDKYSNARGAAKDRAFWLEAFNGAPYSVHRVGRGSVFIENLSASLIGGIQPEPIRKLADDSADDGLLQRLLPVILRPAVEGRDERASEVVFDYAALIRRLYQLDRPLFGGVAEGTVLRFNDAAQAYRQELERKHLELQCCESINRKLASHIGKYDGIFARLCVIWHCVEAAPGTLPQVISERTARRAGAFLHGFLLPHAMAFYAGVLGLSNDQDRLEAVAGYILARKLERVTNRDIQHGDRTMRGLGRPETEAIFDQLDALGWVDRVPGPRPSSPPQWIVNPVVHIKFAKRAADEAERRARERKIIAAMTKGAA